MLTVRHLSAKNVQSIQPLYQDFLANARDRYHWDMAPVAWDVFVPVVGQKVLRGYILEDNATQKPVGFMLYRLEDHRAVEINLIYLQEGVPEKTALDRLLRKFIPDMRELPQWDVISYAMLGVQEHLVRTITWYGFKPYGQSIEKFDFLDPLCVQLLKQQDPGVLPEGYQLDCWQAKYAAATGRNIYLTFSNAADALWDPRFRTEEGGHTVVNLITSGEMGVHHALCSSILLFHGEPVGFCFLVQADDIQGNIPVIAVHPEHKGKGLSHHLLYRTLMKCIEETIAERIGMTHITATVDTDNWPALKMYRRMGFQETYNYPHVYMDRAAVEAIDLGKWCQVTS
ncbi:MAG: N-acetyltransferase [Candidatus Melainabacteria bacterium]|nr:N-acetyltransferase [Candidatus Melainabacteria bacterium]